VVVLNDTIYCATAEGLSILPVSSKIASIPPPIYFSNVIYGNVNITDSSHAKLSFRQSSIIFGFGGITFQQPGKVSYQYRLLGDDEKWKHNTSGIVDYASLPLGNYTFEVKAKKINSNWSQVKSVNFTITGPFWMQNWFFVFVYSFIFSILVLTINFFLRSIRIKKLKKAELHYQLISLEQKALSALMNPHFIFNALNSIQHYLNQNDNLSANRYLSMFAKLTRMNMEAVMQQSVTLENEIERLKLYLQFEKLRFGSKLSYEFIIPEGLNGDELKIPAMILQPLVENAIWHGILPLNEEGKITIKTDLFNEDYIKFTITDNGVGINTDLANNRGLPLDSSNHAINIISQRLRLINIKYKSNLYLQFAHLNPNNARKGTIAEVLLPSNYS
jgi:anti-sigma regulatory factor (Ser/Thr protein kinase)